MKLQTEYIIYFADSKMSHRMSVLLLTIIFNISLETRPCGMEERSIMRVFRRRLQA